MINYLIVVNDCHETIEISRPEDIPRPFEQPRRVHFDQIEKVVDVLGPAITTLKDESVLNTDTPTHQLEQKGKDREPVDQQHHPPPATSPAPSQHPRNPKMQAARVRLPVGVYKEFEVNTFPRSSLSRSNSTRPHPPLLSTITHDTTSSSNSAVTFSQDAFQPPPTLMPFTALLLLR
uniref:FERM domain-containing protein n=2 Tax=Caenorhabditis japonica TaxID=281687 RepID=A0A8R1E9Z3_CAEJA